MKKVLQIILAVFALAAFLNNEIKAQNTYEWLATAPDGNWKQGAAGARWNPGGFWDEPPFGVLLFNNNNQLTMTNNVIGTYSQHKITFGSGNTISRTIGGNTVQLFDYSTIWPWIKNESTVTHTIGIPLIGPTGSYNLELIAATGSLLFTNTINNNGRTIQIYGNNIAIDATNRSIKLSGVVSGSGALNVSQFGVVKLNTNHTYTGETQVDKGELWIETAGDAIASGSSIYLGNGGQLANVAKLFLSKSDGGATFTRTININDGNASTRFLGGVNTSGINIFSAPIALTSSKPLNLEAVSSSGTVEFSGVISGDGAVTTLGAGTIRLSNANTYTGTTTVTAGTLDLSANLASSLITVISGSKLYVSGTDVTINALTIENGGIVEVQAGKSLTVNGTLTNNATDGIVLKSPADISAPGSLKIAGTLAGSGTLKSERFIPAYTSNADGWHLISSPVSTPLLSSTNLTPGSSDDFYAYNEPTYEWLNQKVGANNLTSMANGMGYLVSYATATEAKYISGTPNSSPVTLTDLSYTPAINVKGRGWHIAGNPYPSAIAWNNGSYTLTNVSGVAKMMSNTGGFSDILANGIIPAMQGFYVQVSGSTNTLTIPLNARTHNTASWTKSSENNVILVTANDLETQMLQESWIRINDQATDGYDQEFDSHFLPFYAPQFYSKIGDELLSTNSLPAIPVETVIPFGFEKNNATNFSIELKQSIVGLLVYLTDLKNNTDQNLTENSVYKFTSEAGDDPNRFLLHFLNTTGTVKPTAAQIKVYSTSGKINISGVDGIAEILVRNMMGQVVMRNSVNGSTLQSLNTSNLPAGVYVLSVVSASKTVSQKVVVK